MSSRIERVSERFYHGLWGVLTRWFVVPVEPPDLPALSSHAIDRFKPSDGFLRYLKFQFWIAFAIIDMVIFVVWLGITIADVSLGLLLAVPALILAILPDVIAYLAIHLRYDTTWYVLSDRSLRIRRGIWTIHETTITFENVQNVSVRQGPLQRWFGIADVLVETAGGGGAAAAAGQGGLATMGAHCGLVEGVADAQAIRDRLVAKMGQSRSAGLGDEAHAAPRSASWSPAEVALLREIRDALQPG